MERDADPLKLIWRIAMLSIMIGMGLSVRQSFAFDELFDPPQEDLQLDAVGNHFSQDFSTESRPILPDLEGNTWRTPETRRVSRGSNERLIDRITDPTSWLMDLRLRQEWNWPVEPSDPDSQATQFRPTIPFIAWDQVNLLRVSVSYNLKGSDSPGLGDIDIFDLIVFQEHWGRWGVGPSIRLKPSSESDGDSFLAGPAAGAVTKNKYWTVGVLTQNFLGDSDSETRLQPILAYKPNDQWAISIGESEFRYDWEESTWTQIPLGCQIECIADLGGQKIQFFVNPQYNFQRQSSNSGWTIFVGLTLLVPEA